MAVVETTTFFQRSLRILDTVFHQVIAVVFVYILWVIGCSDIDPELKWHMGLSTIAYVPLMAEAVTAFTEYNFWSFEMSRREKCNAHGSALTLSIILTSAGVILIIVRTVGRHDHFVYEHGWTGLVSWILVLISQLTGFVMLKTHELAEYIRPVWLKFIHNSFGIVGYVFGMVSMAYGLYRPEFIDNTSERAIIFVVCLIALLTFWSIIPGMRSGYRQIKTIVSMSEY